MSEEIRRERFADKFTTNQHIIIDRLCQSFPEIIIFPHS